MNIEEVAEESPEDIVTIPIDISKGMTPSQAQDMARRIRFTGEGVEKAARNMQALYDLFIARDATQVSAVAVIVAVHGCQNFQMSRADRLIARWRSTPWPPPMTGRCTA